MKAAWRKAAGAYYTPDEVAASLVKWVVHHNTDRILDPSCGDGRFAATCFDYFSGQRHYVSLAVAHGINAKCVRNSEGC